MLYVTFMSHGFCRDGKIVREMWMGEILKEYSKMGPSGSKKYYVVKLTHNNAVYTVCADAVKTYIFK